MPPGSPTPLPTYDQALTALLARTPVLETQTVDLTEALGRVLRVEIQADRDQPPFDRSAMDGCGVRSGEVSRSVEFPVAGTVAAGAGAETFQTEMAPRSVMAIATGAPLPAGADGVVPIEQTVVDKSREPVRVRFEMDGVQPGQNVHRRASDASRGQVLLTPGIRLGPHHVGIAAAVGAAALTVSRQPRVTVLTTGDEVRPASTATTDLTPSQIRSSNGPMLVAWLAALGITTLRHEHVPDDPEVTLAAAREALSHSNLVVTVGGVSVGERDYLPRAWHHLGLDTVLHGVNIQPGRPVFVARPAESDDPRLVIGLPGNPVSVLCCAHLFLWPVLRRMAGEIMGDGRILPWRNVRLAGSTKGSVKRQVFRAARIDAEGAATVIGWHGSGDLVHTAAAEGFVRLPLQDEPVSEGAVVPYLPLVGV